jgi:hypothetical protein
MPKEHSGGATPPGLFHVPSEWIQDQATAVRIENFDFEGLDSLDDKIREELALHGSCAGFFRRMVALAVDETRSEITVAILDQVLHDPNFKRAAIECGFACGMLATAGKSGTEYAKDFGVSKEAFQQGIKSRADKLGLRKSATMRDAIACGHMRQANIRPTARKC